MSAGLHAKEAADGMTRLARAGFTVEEATEAARALFGSPIILADQSSGGLYFQCHICGHMLHQDDLSTPVTRESTLALIRLLDREYVRHLLRRHPVFLVRWVFSGRPVRQWFV